MNDATATLALCIPAYNASAFLARLLASARAQTVAFDEIWVYDDASSDDTAALARSLGAQVIRGEKNAGCSHGKNALAASTACDWIHFHDADDALEPTFVAAAKRWMRLPDCPDIVLFAYRAVDDITGAEFYIRTFDSEYLQRDAVACCLTEQINPFSGIYRRDAFLACGGWDEDKLVLFCEDQAGHLHMALSGLRFGADSEVTVINHIRSGSMSGGNLARCPRAEYHMMKKNWPRTAPHHRPLIAARLWKIAGAAGSFLDWSTADSCISLANQLHTRPTIDGSPAFRLLARLAPRLALRLREQLVRLTRPQLRANPQYHPRRA